MTIFKTQTRLAATVYIRATTKDEALAKLRPLYGATLDLRDRSWFSDAMGGDDSLPEVSLATSMTLYPPEAVDNLEVASRSELQQALAIPRTDGINNPYNEENAEGLTNRVFSVDLRMEGSVYIEAGAQREVVKLLSPCRGVDVNYIEDWVGRDCIDRPKFPAAICPYLTLVGIWAGNDWELSWDDDDNGSEHKSRDDLKVIADLKKIRATRTFTDDEIAALQMIEANIPYLKDSLIHTVGRSGKVTDEELTELAMSIARRSVLRYLTSQPRSAL